MNTARQFHVVFTGAIAAGRDRAEVRARLVRLFGSPAKVDALFAGGRVLVKRYVAESEALRYQRAFAAAGAPCELVPADGAGAAGPGAVGKRTLAYGSPAARPRRTTPVYGSPVFADDEVGIPEEVRSASQPAGPNPPPPKIGSPASVSPPQRAVEPTPAPPAPPAPPPQRRADAGRSAPPAAPIPDLVPIQRATAAAGGAAVGAAVAGILPGALTSPAVARHHESRLDDDWPGPFERDTAGSIEAAGGGALQTFDEAAVSLAGSGLALDDERTPAPREGAGDALDLSLPRLARDPGSGRIVAVAPPGPERPGRSAQDGALGPPGRRGARRDGAAVATPILRGSDRDVGYAVTADLAHSPAMVAAVDRSRFGLTVISLSLFVSAALLACGSLGSLLTLNLPGFVVAAATAVVTLLGAQRLWAALGAAQAAVGGSPAAIEETLEQQARFFRLWGWLHAVGLAFGAFAVLAALAFGAGAVWLAPGSARPAERPTVVGWSRRPTPSGYELRFQMGDGTRRSVRCARDAAVGFQCECWLGAEQSATFDIRSEPMNANAAVEVARDGCDWALELDLSP